MEYTRTDNLKLHPFVLINFFFRPPAVKQTLKILQTGSVFSSAKSDYCVKPKKLTKLASEETGNPIKFGQINILHK